MFEASRRGTWVGDSDKDEQTVLLLIMLFSYKPVKKASLRENIYHDNFLAPLPLTPSFYTTFP